MGVVELRQYFSLFANTAFKSTKGAQIARESTENGYSLEHNDALRQIAGAGCDLVSMHHRTGEVIDCSFSDLTFHGLERGDLQGAAFLERVHIADRPAFLGALSQACHGNEKVRVELRLSCPSMDGAADYFCWIEMACSSLREPGRRDDEGGAPVMCVTRDITHFKEREQELIDLQRETLETLEIKTRLLSNMSHELRTPLNAIIGFSEMMKLPGITAQNEQQMVEYAGFINDSGRHLLGVVDEVFEFSQLAEGQSRGAPRNFSLGDLVSASMELVQLEAEEKKQRLVIGEYDEALEMNADWQVCKQVLVALLVAQIDAGIHCGAGLSGGSGHTQTLWRSLSVVQQGLMITSLSAIVFTRIRRSVVSLNCCRAIFRSQGTRRGVKKSSFGCLMDLRMA